MIFLNPAVLFGLLAASIPVLIHLLNLRKLKKIEFSTLAFLKELQKTKIRKIKLKQWILLALRILIILLLVAAFARPTIKSVSIGGTASAAKTSAVIILDDTYSMSVITDRGSYFNRAKQTAKLLLDEFQEGDEVSLVFSAGGKIIEASINLNSVRNLIDDAELSYTAGTIHNALIKAGQILSGSRNFNKEIYLLSDFQKSELKMPETVLSDLSGLISNRIRIYTIDFTVQDPANLTINDFKVKNQIFEKGKLINFSASVKNTSGKSFNNSLISLFINGNRSAQQSFNTAPGETKLIDFETTLKDNGFIEIFAELEDDDILYDNKRYLSITVPPQINTAIFYDKVADAKFVELALNGSSDSAPISVQKFPLSRISSINLNSYEVVIIIGSESVSNYEGLINYYKNGGGIFVMPGSGSTLSNFQKLCGTLGMPLPSALTGESNDKSVSVTFDKIDFQHPIFSNLFEKELTGPSEKGEKKIESPAIYKYFKTNVSGSGKKIISLIDGVSFLSEYNNLGSRILLLNVAPVLDWSSFPLKGIFAPLMNKAVFYISSVAKEVNDYKTGDEILVNINDIQLPLLKIIKPVRGEETINLDSLGIKNYFKYSKSQIPGIYKFYSDGKIFNYAAVNFNAIGSELEYLSENDFEKYLSEINFSGIHLNVSPDENFSSAIYQSRFGSELWRFFVIAALIVALIEMFVARSAKKDLIT